METSVDRPTITVLGSQIVKAKRREIIRRKLGGKFGSCCPGLSLHLAEEFDPIYSSS